MSFSLVVILQFSEPLTPTYSKMTFVKGNYYTIPSTSSLTILEESSSSSVTVNKWNIQEVRVAFDDLVVKVSKHH